MTRILVTGATGFIGGRFAEAAVLAGHDVGAIVRSWSTAARLARNRVEMFDADLLDPSALEAAVAGYDAVVHCAVDNKAAGEQHLRSSIEGTENMLRAATKARVRRFVHLSSVAVYSYRPKPDAATEAGEIGPTGDFYCDGKIEAEHAVLRHNEEHDLPFVILRPSIVYGPFSSWTRGTVAAIRESRAALVDGGNGVCNAVYVDDVVQAILLSLSAEQAVGETLHVSGPEPVSWRAFFEGHARALGEEYLSLPEISSTAAAHSVDPDGVSSLRRMAEILANPRVRRELRSVPAVARFLGCVPSSARARLRRRLERVTSDSESGQLVSLSDDAVAIQQTAVTFSIDKAVKVLGYRPQFEWNRGMASTAAWIDWAHL